MDSYTPNAHSRWFTLIYHVWGPAWLKTHWNSIRLRAQSHTTSHYIWGSETPRLRYVISKVSWDGLWTLTIGLSQFHAHGSWLVCEVALGVVRSYCEHAIFNLFIKNQQHILLVSVLGCTPNRIIPSLLGKIGGAWDKVTELGTPIWRRKRKGGRQKQFGWGVGLCGHLTA